ncbi:hypothetical protein DFP72DRAFT_1010378 [Ephemerocybe angulata]|uniref:Uncharacterized protein n=1 Tax=Ephemerocybe angulata TaxID=980116 RepID=A0A8H6HXD4_9AGAR|nr:hypothetical protein DFP72DRAFT_1010378 [Tulosesus angulatus]
MKDALGWGDERDLSGMIRRGDKGVGALLGFMKHYIERGVDPGLFEGKLERLMVEMGKFLNGTTVSPSSPSFASAAPILSTHPASRPIPNYIAVSDDDDLEIKITAHPVSTKRRPTDKTCLGYHLGFPPGKSPHASYPFMLHQTQNLPWDYSVEGDRMTLRSRLCTKKRAPDMERCVNCHELQDNNTLRGIQERIEKGVNENSPYAYHGIAGLIDLLKLKKNNIEFHRLRGLNHARKLLSQAVSITDHKRLLTAVASGCVQRVERIVHLGLKQKQGIAAIINKIKLAADGVYKVKSYTDRERFLSTLLWRLGGARVGGILHRALGLPGISTLRESSTVPSLTPSPGRPRVEEVMMNVEASLDGVEEMVKADSNIRHMVLMFDEIATEKRIRWDQTSNMILGACREHAEKVSLEFVNEGVVEELLKMVDVGEVHLAAEATVAAMGILCENHRVYPARPVLVSADCKRETGEQHATILQTVLDGIAKSPAPSIGLRVVSLASDGESRRGSALVQLTMKRPLSTTSPIYPLLAPLELMNRHVGDDDLTADKDWKHVFKRLRNLLLRSRGVVIAGTRITPDILKAHLRAHGTSSEHINAIFNPNDLQDVKLAFDMLRDIWSLPKEAPELSNPGFKRAREAIWVLGRFLYHLVFPYLCVYLSLSDQLEHLSAAAHLALTLYAQAGKDFLPTLLYSDIMIMIKNVFFCVAKAKIDTPEGTFYIILLGTDRLEILFGILRTMIGNDMNLDILQLLGRLASTLDVAKILALFPEWDRGPRRLRLPGLDLTGAEIPDASDHLSPSHWKGSTLLKLVSLLTSWRRGRARAEEIYPDAITVLKQLVESGNDLLSPNGVYLFEVPLEQDDIDESVEMLEAHIPIPDEEAELNHDAQVEVEDELIEFALDASPPPASNGSLSASPRKFSTTISINGKDISKAKVISMMTKYRRTVASLDRLKRVRDVERFTSESRPDISLQPSPSSDRTKSLLVHDPITTLLACDSSFWLCIGEVIGIKLDGQAVPDIDHALLPEPTVSVTFQLLGLRPAVADDVAGVSTGAEYDWRTYTTMEKSFEVPGRLIQVVNPETAVVPSKGSFYLFGSPSLMALGSLLLQGMSVEDLKRVPKVLSTTEYPYREPTGRLLPCFLRSFF